MNFDPITIARAWLPVSVASSRDAARPQLCRTVHVEQHINGVRLVATDSYILLHAYAPDASVDADLPATPGLHNEPERTATIIDPHGRGAGLLAYAYKLATAKDADPDDYPVTLDLDHVQESTEASFDGLAARRCRLTVNGESLTLPVYEGSFPDWTKVAADRPAISLPRIALNPARLKQLVKAASYTPNAGIGWSFTDPHGPAMVELIDTDPFISGVVMPVRWDLDTNTPVVVENDDGEPVPSDEQQAWDDIMRRYYTDPDEEGNES